MKEVGHAWIPSPHTRAVCTTIEMRVWEQAKCNSKRERVELRNPQIPLAHAHHYIGKSRLAYSTCSSLRSLVSSLPRRDWTFS